MTKNIFVYGTLKKSYHNHSFLKGCELLDDNFVVSGFKLFESGIPFMKKTDTMSDRVRGEVYAVPSEILKHVDRLEGHPTGYHREEIMDGIESYIYPHSLGNTKESPKVDGVYVYGRSPTADAFGREKQV